MADEMFELFSRLRAGGVTILLVQKNVERALTVADRTYIMYKGVIVHHDAANVLLANAEIQEHYCAV